MLHESPINPARAPYSEAGHPSILGPVVRATIRQHSPITGASSDRDALVVNFDNGETLLILRPVEETIDGATFTIRDAASVRWEWNAYGDPPGSRYFEEYVRHGDQIRGHHRRRLVHSHPPTIWG